MQSVKLNNKLIIFFLLQISFYSCNKVDETKHQPTVEVRYFDGRAQLFRNGEPYFIKGAGGSEHLEKIAAYGGNSIRTWDIQDAERILDEAHKLGLTVALGLQVGRPSWGENFNYWNFWEVNKKIEELRPVIDKFKGHPALLIWGIGNEVELFGGGKRFLIYYTINRIAKMIKEVDPNHPTMTAIPVPPLRNRIGSFRHILTHVDILGYNAFNSLPTMYDKIYGPRGWGKAYMVSEWGPTGHWECIYTEWGAPIELSMKEKVDMMKKSWHTMNIDSVLFLGSYAFYWGHKYEITHTWFSMFSEEGCESDQVKFLQKAWSGQNSENLAPTIEHISIDPRGKNDYFYLKADQIYSAKVIVNYLEMDSLSYRWELRKEESKYYETGIFKHKMEDNLFQKDSPIIEFKAPKQEGDYRLFVFVFDEYNNFTFQNIPFYVIN